MAVSLIGRRLDPQFPGRPSKTPAQGAPHFVQEPSMVRLQFPSTYQLRSIRRWDIDTSQLPLLFEVQGLLALEDTPEDGGGFQCVPGFPERFDEWLTTQPSDRDPMRPDLARLEVKQVQLLAGDLLIWSRLLPHGASPNRSVRPRLAQYISMFPVPPDSEALCRERIHSWIEHLPRAGYAFPEDQPRREQTFSSTARLTPLGRKLLGLDSWE